MYFIETSGKKRHTMDTIQWRIVQNWSSLLNEGRNNMKKNWQGSENAFLEMPAFVISQLGLPKQQSIRIRQSCSKKCWNPWKALKNRCQQLHKGQNNSHHKKARQKHRNSGKNGHEKMCSECLTDAAKKTCQNNGHQRDCLENFCITSKA